MYEISDFTKINDFTKNIHNHGEFTINHVKVAHYFHVKIKMKVSLHITG